MSLRITRTTLRRLLVIATVFAVVGLATHAVTHFHSAASDEARCQICHIGHASAPGPSAPVAVQTPVPLERFTLPEQAFADFSSFRAPSIPRAPPA
jgi:hypothetical protein